MTNNFQTITKGNNYNKVGDVIFTAYQKRVRHANGTTGQDLVYSTVGTEMQPSTDRELLKVWNHATIERKYGVYASKPILQKELESRGYVLTENKHRWKKVEMVL